MGTYVLASKREEQPPTFWPMYSGQRAGWIQMPLDTEVGLCQGHIVIDGDTAPPPKKGHSSPPILDPCLLWPNGWMDQDATWYGSRPRPWPHCVRWGPSSPSKGHSGLPLFCSPCLLWPNSRPSQLLLSTCLFVYEISREPLNRFVPNSRGRRIWPLGRTSLKVKVTRDKNGIFGFLAACVPFMFGKNIFSL